MTLKIKQQEREKYYFYDNEICLEYDPVDHVYLLDNVEVPGVTGIVKIIDKSAVLINWAVKLTADKILSTSVDFPITRETLSEIVLDAKKAHRQKLENAANIGKSAHAQIEQIIKDRLSHPITIGDDSVTWTSILRGPTYIDQVDNCVGAALDWMTRHNVRWVCTERKIYSRTFKYAGTLDGIARVDSCQDRECCPEEFKDRLSLIDWKSSNQLYNEYLLQTSGLTRGHTKKRLGEIIHDRWVIRLGKDDGEFEAWHIGPESYYEDWYAFEHCLALTQSIKSVTLRMKEFKKKKNHVKKAKR